jgi:hypothetical protein
LKAEKITGYEYILFSTSSYGEKQKWDDSYLKYLGFVPRAQKGLLLIEHNFTLCFEKYGEEEYLREGRLFTLWPFRNTPFLNPHYFGESAARPKNGKTRFVGIGTVATEKFSFSSIVAAVEKLNSLGEENFEALIIGRGKSPKIPGKLAKYIKFKGDLSFADMFEELRGADFILLPLNSAVERYREYLAGKVSGSNQLMLGFNKPCIIDKTFAEAYGLSEQNAVIYGEGGLHAAMAEAVAMGPDEYLKMQENLHALADGLYEKSLDNLRSALKMAENKRPAPASGMRKQAQKARAPQQSGN